MKLGLQTKFEQSQVLAPQMILSMDILLLNSMDLENRIEQEFMENPALELEEPKPEEEPAGILEQQDSPKDKEVQELFELLNAYESRYGGEEAPARQSGNLTDNKHEAMMNHAEQSHGLMQHLKNELLFLGLDSQLSEICQELIGNIDQRGYLLGNIEEIASSLSISLEVAKRALLEIQKIEPAGIGATDLSECLLLQLGEQDVLERLIVEKHLPELLENRLPKIAELTSKSLNQVKQAYELIRSLDPHPGNQFATVENSPSIPELFVEEVEGKFKVRMEEGHSRNLRISPACSSMLQSHGEDKQVVDYVRRKIESARWLIHAIDQRRRTLLDIAQAIVNHQQDFLRKGDGHLSALTMQSIADEVGVHISTVSRATNGKYIETPFGVVEMRKFFTGGVERQNGGIECRDNVCQVIRSIVAKEDKKKPFSDSQLTRKLQERGLDIARRTVTKYRERAGVSPARLRKVY